MRKKTMIILLILGGCFVISDLLAQDQNSIMPTGPYHPLINYGHIRANQNIDTLFTNRYYKDWVDMVSKYGVTELQAQKIARSEDNLTDTLIGVHFDYFTGAPIRWSTLDIYHYNEKHQLLYNYIHNFNHPFYQYTRTEYEYDEEGRVVKQVVKSVTPAENISWVYDEETQLFKEVIELFEIPSEKITQEWIYDYSTVQMTEKGYSFRYYINDYQNDDIIANDWNVELDNQGRVTFYKTDVLIKVGDKFLNAFYGNSVKATEDRYAEYTDGKKYLIDATYFTYTDSSYTALGCYDRSKWSFETQYLRWDELTYVFYENGDLKRKIHRSSLDGEKWNIFYLDEYAYAYSNESETRSGDEVSNDNVRKYNTIVFAHSGAISIITENAATVQIFDLAGRLVKQQALSAGENRINVFGSGFYFVKVGNESFKVFVR